MNVSEDAALRRVDGELEVCTLCGRSPHTAACPRHEQHDDDTRRWFRNDAPSEVGPARYWVEDTFAAAASDGGKDFEAALREGMEEFERAVREGWLRRA